MSNGEFSDTAEGFFACSTPTCFGNWHGAIVAQKIKTYWLQWSDPYIQTCETCQTPAGYSIAPFPTVHEAGVCFAHWGKSWFISVWAPAGGLCLAESRSLSGGSPGLHVASDVTPTGPAVYSFCFQGAERQRVTGGARRAKRHRASA